MASHEEPVESGLGLCQSWKDQQNRISAILQGQKSCYSADRRLLLAQYDHETITVYQAYKPSIALSAARNGHFDNCEFSFSRMTWIKPSFSWMMHRSGWASKKNQEAVLAIKLRRSYFDQLLSQGVSTSWDRREYKSLSGWRSDLQDSDVLIQWDPEHHILSGHRIGYRVIQIGVRRSALKGFQGDGIVSIANISARVLSLRKEILSSPPSDGASCENETPLETLYPANAVTGLHCNE